MDREKLYYFKQDKGYSYQKISELSGVPVGTIRKIFQGETKTPRYETISAIEKVLYPKEYEFRPAPEWGLNPCGEKISENSYSYGRKKRYTLKDYYALPDDKRVELIDGYFYDMAAPSTVHQFVAGELHFLVKQFIEEQNGSCIPYISPVDVQLDEDDFTMVQPDLLVICDHNKITNRCIFGGPDWVVEVVSPFSKRKDSFLKLAKYAEAGVREYWLVDTDKKKVIVYDLEHDECPAIYGFDEQIPVAIWEGKLKIDFRRIDNKLEMLKKH